MNGLDPYDSPSDYVGVGNEPFDGKFTDNTNVTAAFNNDCSEIWGAGDWQSESLTS
ncbi:hypothetical protein [Moritella yayanosii]|uniref:Uncharacterized protein n=1 Tax=Moritella yayanosii TaxID=69539 RepID=A0A330LUC1_9GAMM|nr:hypothetical protein [Moritella yayanosii]SQD80577.1 protein of unknown function [Moritella yayanosii]